jgi:hypothetical protein
MVNLDNDLIFFNNLIIIKKPILNDELKFLKFFYENTKILPINILIRHNFIFIFVNNEDYFNAKILFRKLRYKLNLPPKKFLIMRAESTFLRLIFTFFQDTYIHDVIFESQLKDKVKIIRILFFLNVDRLIAVGNNGNYIKTINFIINNYLYIKIHNWLTKIGPVEIICDLVK